MNFLYGVLVAAGAIIAAEIYFNYSLGDKLKDLFLSEEAKIVSARNKFVAAQNNLVANLKAVEKKVF